MTKTDRDEQSAASARASAGPPRPPVGYILKIFLFVLLLGPPLGTVPLWIMMALVKFPADAANGLGPGLLDVGAGMLFTALMSYIVGGVPALIAAVWLASTQRPGMPLSYARVLLIAAVSALPLTLLAVANMPGVASAIFAGSIFSAIACRAIAGWLGWVARV